MKGAHVVDTSIRFRNDPGRCSREIANGFRVLDVGHNLARGAANVPLAARIVVLLIMAAVMANAQQQTINEPSTILTLYSGLATAWYARILPIATGLFWSLVALELGYWAINSVFSGGDFNYLLGGVVKKVLSVGFWFFMLTNAGNIIPAIVNGLEQMGAIGSGFAVRLSPSDVLSIGYKLAGILDKASYDAGWYTLPTPASLSLTFATWVVFASFAWIAFLLVQYSVYGYLLVAAGAFGLAFGATRWTEQFASKYLAMAVEVGVRLFTLQLMVGAGMFLVANWVGIAQGIPNSQSPSLGAKDIAFSSLMFAGLIWSVSRFMSSLASGGVHHTGAEVVAMMSVVAGSAMQGARMGAGAGNVAAGVAAGAGGGTGAMSVSQAASIGSSGSSSNGTGSSPVGTAAGGGSNESGSNGSGKASPKWWRD